MEGRGSSGPGSGLADRCLARHPKERLEDLRALTARPSTLDPSPLDPSSPPYTVARVLSIVPRACSAAWAPARRAIGTRKGEQDT